MLLGKGAERQLRWEKQMTPSERGVRDSWGGWGHQDWGQATGSVKGGGTRSRQGERKQSLKARHFPNHKAKCRVAPGGARVTLWMWAVGSGERGGPSPVGQESRLGLSLSARVQETLPECVIEGWGTRLGPDHSGPLP